MSDFSGSQSSEARVPSRPSLLTDSDLQQGKAPSLSVLAALSDSPAPAQKKRATRSLVLGFGIAGAALCAFVAMLSINNITTGHEAAVATAPELKGGAVISETSTPTPVKEMTAAVPASAPHWARLEELPATGAGAAAAAGLAGAAGAGAVALSTAGSTEAAAAVRPVAKAPEAPSETRQSPTREAGAARETRTAREGRGAREAQDARKAREAREARAARTARAAAEPRPGARPSATVAAVRPAAAAAPGVAVAAAAAAAPAEAPRPGGPDADVDLIAALVQHMSGAGAGAGGEPTIADLVTRCKALPGAEAQRCLRRICDNYWGRAEACPRSAASPEVAARR